MGLDTVCVRYYPMTTYAKTLAMLMRLLNAKGLTAWNLETAANKALLINNARSGLYSVAELAQVENAKP